MKPDLANKTLSRQVVLGVLVIGMGLLFLLDDMAIWNVRLAIEFWPMLFIVVGVVKLFDTRSADGYLLGAVLVLIGVLMMLGRLGMIDLRWRTLWPLALIGLGTLVLSKAIASRRQIGAVPKDGAGSDDVVDISAILGGTAQRITTPNFLGGEVTAVMGGCTLDMRGATIASEAVLNVFALFGGVTIKCPPDWTVVLRGTPIMGGFDDKTAPPPDNSTRLVVRGYAIMGGVEVRN